MTGPDRAAYEDERLAVALLRGEPGAEREAEGCALPETHPVTCAVRYLLRAASAGRAAMGADPSRGRERFALAFEAAFVGDAALRAVEAARGVPGARVALPDAWDPATALC